MYIYIYIYIYIYYNISFTTQYNSFDPCLYANLTKCNNLICELFFINKEISKAYYLLFLFKYTMCHINTYITLYIIRRIIAYITKPNI